MKSFCFLFLSTIAISNVVFRIKTSFFPHFHSACVSKNRPFLGSSQLTRSLLTCMWQPPASPPSFRVWSLFLSIGNSPNALHIPRLWKPHFSFFCFLCSLYIMPYLSLFCTFVHRGKKKTFSSSLNRTKKSILWNDRWNRSLLD